MDGTTTAWAHDDLSAGTRHQYFVTAVTAAGEGSSLEMLAPNDHEHRHSGMTVTAAA